MGKKLLGELVDDSVRKGEKWLNEAEADERFEVFCEFCNVAVVNGSKLARQERTELVTF